MVRRRGSWPHMSQGLVAEVCHIANKKGRCIPVKLLKTLVDSSTVTVETVRMVEFFGAIFRKIRKSKSFENQV
jgi:hypothetical protein